MSGRPLPEPEDDHDRFILGHIATRGWAVLGITEDEFWAKVRRGALFKAVGTLLDSQYRIIARTREMDRFIGLMPSEETLRAVSSIEGGVRRFATLDGNDYLWAWSTTVDGWIADGVGADQTLLIVLGNVAARDIITLSTIQNTLFQAQDQLAVVRLSYFQAATSLYQALGGGWSPTTRDAEIAQANAAYEADKGLFP